MSITITGHTPTPGDPTTVSVDLHFLSGALDETINPPPLVAPTSGMLFNIAGPDPSTYVDVTNMISQATGVSDLHVRYLSPSVPEPASLTLFGLGGLGLAGLGWRKRKAAKAQS